MGISNVDININVYENLLIEKDDFNSWQRFDSFVIETLTESDRNDLQNFALVEVELVRKTAGIENDFYASVEKIFDMYLKNVLSDNIGWYYGVVCDYMPMLKNRIRSYKGVISDELKKSGDFLEFEIDYTDTLSLYVGIIKLDSENMLRYEKDFFTDAATGCIIKTNEDLLNLDFIKEFPFKYMVHNDTSTIDYSSLIRRILKTNNNYLFRVGGDGGSSCMSLQIFCKKDKFQSLLKKLKSIKL